MHWRTRDFVYDIHGLHLHWRAEHWKFTAHTVFGNSRHIQFWNFAGYTQFLENSWAIQFLEVHGLRIICHQIFLDKLHDEPITLSAVFPASVYLLTAGFEFSSRSGWMEWWNSVQKLTHRQWFSKASLHHFHSHVLVL